MTGFFGSFEAFLYKISSGGVAFVRVGPTRLSGSVDVRECDEGEKLIARTRVLAYLMHEMSSKGLLFFWDNLVGKARRGIIQPRAGCVSR